MSGTLFDEIVFGPIKSRRFGVSLGINLLPLQGKFCSFDCIYCECGLNAGQSQAKPKLFSAAEIKISLQNRFEGLKNENLHPDNITFAGNGEPTLHPEFELIIKNTIELRNTYFPEAHITVLSNATRLGNASVKKALLSIDNNVLKLDAGSDACFQAINRPSNRITLQQVVDELIKFEGKLVIQTMLVRGEVDGAWVDNTTEAELALYVNHVKQIKPRLVMLYPIDRQTPYRTLEKVPESEFQALVERLKANGINAEVFY